MKIDQTELENTLTQIAAIREEVFNSDHDGSGSSPEDYDVTTDEIRAWMEEFSFPIPLAFNKYDVEVLPQIYWEKIFGDTPQNSMTDGEYEETKKTDEYRRLITAYEDVFWMIKEVAIQSGSYYDAEANDHDNYLNSMRGSI